MKNIKNIPLAHMDEMERYLTLRGVDPCKFHEIFITAREAQIATKLPKTKRELASYLEKSGVGGLGQIVDQVHDSLVEREMITASECHVPRVKKREQEGPGIL